MKANIKLIKFLNIIPTTSGLLQTKIVDSGCVVKYDGGTGGVVIDDDDDNSGGNEDDDDIQVV